MKKQHILQFSTYFILGAIFTFTFVQCSKQKSIEEILIEEAKLVNKQGPILEDVVTRRDSCSVVDGKTFQYHYSLLVIDSASIAEFKNTGIAEVKTSIKTNPIYAPFRTEDVTFRLIYSDTLGVELFRFDVIPEDYK